MTSDRNDSLKIFNHLDSFLPYVSASILKSNYAKLLARSICIYGIYFWQSRRLDVDLLSTGSVGNICII